MHGSDKLRERLTHSTSIIRPTKWGIIVPQPFVECKVKGGSDPKGGARILVSQKWARITVEGKEKLIWSEADQ
jgi:hypothetical protein